MKYRIIQSYKNGALKVMPDENGNIVVDEDYDDDQEEQSFDQVVVTALFEIVAVQKLTAHNSVDFTALDEAMYALDQIVNPDEGEDETE